MKDISENIFYSPNFPVCSNARSVQLQKCDLFFSFQLSNFNPGTVRLSNNWPVLHNEASLPRGKYSELHSLGGELLYIKVEI